MPLPGEEPLEISLWQCIVGRGKEFPELLTSPEEFESGEFWAELPWSQAVDLIIKSLNCFQAPFPAGAWAHRLALCAFLVECVEQDVCTGSVSS